MAARRCLMQIFSVCLNTGSRQRSGRLLPRGNGDRSAVEPKPYPPLERKTALKTLYRRSRSVILTFLPGAASTTALRLRRVRLCRFAEPAPAGIAQNMLDSIPVCLWRCSHTKLIPSESPVGRCGRPTGFFRESSSRNSANEPAPP